MYIRTVNSYLSWLREEGQIDASLRVKLLRAPQHQKTLLSAADVRALLQFKPRTVVDRRTWTGLPLRKAAAQLGVSKSFLHDWRLSRRVA